MRTSTRARRAALAGPSSYKQWHAATMAMPSNRSPRTCCVGGTAAAAFRIAFLCALSACVNTDAHSPTTNLPPVTATSKSNQCVHVAWTVRREESDAEPRQPPWQRTSMAVVQPITVFPHGHGAGQRTVCGTTYAEGKRRYARQGLGLFPAREHKWRGHCARVAKQLAKLPEDSFLWLRSLPFPCYAKTKAQISR